MLRLSQCAGFPPSMKSLTMLIYMIKLCSFLPGPLIRLRIPFSGFLKACSLGCSVYSDFRKLSGLSVISNLFLVRFLLLVISLGWVVDWLSKRRSQERCIWLYGLGILRRWRTRDR